MPKTITPTSKAHAELIEKTLVKSEVDFEKNLIHDPESNGAFSEPYSSVFIVSDSDYDFAKNAISNAEFALRKEKEAMLPPKNNKWLPIYAVVVTIGMIYFFVLSQRQNLSNDFVDSSWSTDMTKIIEKSKSLKNVKTIYTDKNFNDNFENIRRVKDHSKWSEIIDENDDGMYDVEYYFKPNGDTLFFYQKALDFGVFGELLIWKSPGEYRKLKEYGELIDQLK